MSNKTSDKNVANIERLNNFIEAYKQTKEQSFIVDSINKDFFFEFVDCLLSEREQKDKRIQELEEERDHWHGCFIVAMENGIAKQVVINTINDNGFEVYTKEYGNVEVVSIEVLQELLEGERK